MSKFTPSQQELLNKAIPNGELVSTAALKLADWPTLTFVLEGAAGDVSLKVSPSDYWQVDTEEVGSAAVAITEGDPGFVILGLPLMNGYFTIFDGEAVVIHEGRTNFSELQADLASGRQDRSYGWTLRRR